MNTDDSVEVYYPAWVQLISVLGVPVFTVSALWLLTRPLWEDGIGAGQFLAGAAFGAAVLYQCVLGWRALRYLRVRMIASARGLEVTAGTTRRLFAWHDLAVPKDYTFAGTTRLSLRTGEHILYAFDNMKNVRVVKEAILEHHGDSAPP